MARVTDDNVKEIISTTVDCAPFITAADLIVTERLTGSGLSDAMLKEITRWLAAHLVAIRDPIYKTEKTGDAMGTMFGQAGMGLDFTPYGQQVKVLDTSGLLADLGLKSAGLEVVDFLDGGT